MEGNIHLRGSAGRPTVAVALRTHTGVVVVFILAVTAYGLWFARTSTPATSSERHIIAQMYVPALVYEWVLLGFVWLGVRGTTGLRELVGGRWTAAWDAFADVALGLGFWCAWYVVEKVVQYLLGPSTL